MRGEWIEIIFYKVYLQTLMSLPMRGEWIEICPLLMQQNCIVSLPMRGEWIEIAWCFLLRTVCTVSPHAGRVD